jgi:hypothetical protein
LPGLTVGRLVLSVEGRHEFLVARAGHDLYLDEKATDAPNFPRITVADRIARVETAEPSHASGALPTAVAMPHGEVAVLADTTRHPTWQRTLTVIVARRGQSLHRWPLEGHSPAIRRPATWSPSRR